MHSGFKNTTDRKMTTLFFILILMSIFAIMALIVVMIGADAYKKVAHDMECTSDLRIPISYVSSKIRQGDQAGAVRVISKDGVNVLILESNDNQMDYETWIYQRDDLLYEVTVEGGTDFDLKDGIAILPVHNFNISMENPSLLKVTASDKSGRQLEQLLALRSDTDHPDAAEYDKDGMQ